MATLSEFMKQYDKALPCASVGCQGSKNDDIANGDEATHFMNRCL